MIPANITRDHVLQAIAQVKRDGVPTHRQATRYHILYDELRYPPKLIISIANKYANGEELNPVTFFGGDESNSFLVRRGFEIVGSENRSKSLSECHLLETKRLWPSTATRIPTNLADTFDASRRRALIAALSDIPWDRWDEIVLGGPGWRTMQSFLPSYGFGPYAVLMVMLGLNDYQLKGPAETGYWPAIETVLLRGPVPSNLQDLNQTLRRFFKTERLGSRKIQRLANFLASGLAQDLWSCKPSWVGEHFHEVWKRLS